MGQVLLLKSNLYLKFFPAFHPAFLKEFNRMSAEVSMFRVVVCADSYLERI